MEKEENRELMDIVNKENERMRRIEDRSGNERKVKKEIGDGKGEEMNIGNGKREVKRRNGEKWKLILKLRNRNMVGIEDERKEEEIVGEERNEEMEEVIVEDVSEVDIGVERRDLIKRMSKWIGEEENEEKIKEMIILKEVIIIVKKINEWRNIKIVEGGENGRSVMGIIKEERNGMEKKGNIKKILERWVIRRGGRKRGKRRGRRRRKEFSDGIEKVKFEKMEEIEGKLEMIGGKKDLRKKIRRRRRRMNGRERRRRWERWRRRRGGWRIGLIIIMGRWGGKRWKVNGNMEEKLEKLESIELFGSDLGKKKRRRWGKLESKIVGLKLKKRIIERNGLKRIIEKI